jgi:hypothetical protein
LRQLPQCFRLISCRDLFVRNTDGAEKASDESLLGSPTKLTLDVCVSFGFLFGTFFLLSTTFGLLFFEAFFAGSAAFLGDGSHKVMDELIVWVFATAEGGEQTLLN